MFEFFYEEFQNLRLKTGIRQWEQLNEQPDAAKVIHDTIEFMCQECNKPPYHVVRPEVKQRVICRAIVEDQEFIGLNAKFVQRALNKWWMVNGDRVMEAMNEHKIAERIDLPPERSAEIDRMLDEYKANILKGDGPRMVPKVQSVEKEGAEWQSNIDRKAINHPPDSVERVQAHELHMEWIRRNFDPRTGDKLPTWKPEQEWTDQLTEEAKIEIFKRGKCYVKQK